MSDQARAAIYLRVSSEEQSRGYSLTEQEAALRARAAVDGASRVAVFSDIISGARTDRPDYQRLLAAAAAGELDVLYCWKLDRLGRDAEELLRARRMLAAAGVRIVSTTEGEDESTLVFGVRALVAQEEREKIGERTRVGKAAAARAGRPNGGPRRFGFTQRDGQLIARPDEIMIVERILREAISGRSQAAIAAGLNADGVRTARGKLWQQTQISQVTTDPIWIGILRNKEGDHKIAEPFVNAALWQAAQKTLRGPGGPRTGRRTQHFLLGGGLLRCACGAGMIVKRERKDYGFYEVYICGGRSGGASPGCTQRAVQRASIDSSVLSYFEHVGLDVEATRAELAARADRERTEIRLLHGQADLELARAEERLERVKRAFQDGAIEADDWSEHKTQLEGELQAARADAARLAAREAEVADEPVEDVDLLARLTDLRCAIAGDVTANPDFAATHAALRRVFASFTLRSIDAGSNWWAQEPDEPVLTCDAEPTYVLEPLPRHDAVVLTGDGIAIRPVALQLTETAGNSVGGINASSR